MELKKVIADVEKRDDKFTVRFFYCTEKNERRCNLCKRSVQVDATSIMRLMAQKINVNNYHNYLVYYDFQLGRNKQDEEDEPFIFNVNSEFSTSLDKIKDLPRLETMNFLDKFNEAIKTYALKDFDNFSRIDFIIRFQDGYKVDYNELFKADIFSSFVDHFYS